MSNGATITVPRHLPGETGIWIFVLGDMSMFALFFCVFLFYRAGAVDLYNASQATLNTTYGAINTLFLLASSWFVALAINAARLHMTTAVTRLLILALSCGLAFAVIKILEYSEKINADITLVTNDFYMFYFILTGVHFLHVLIGIGVLFLLTLKSKRASFKTGDMQIYESGASFWHMVDLLWIVLFPLLYLIK